jgi:hypothetical protein
MAGRGPDLTIGTVLWQMEEEAARKLDRRADAEGPIPVDGRPILLVDVDGVLSVFGFPQHAAPPGRWANVEGVTHLLSHAAADEVRALTGAFAPVWCTGWEERANEHLPHLVGLGPWPFLTFDRAMGRTSSHGHWKLAAIDAAVGPDRPLAWIDDDLGPACEAWAAARPGPTLLVTTHPATGLTPAQGAALRAWAAARSGV